jgi:DNA-binding NarL/FixJ family response regulator
MAGTAAEAHTGRMDTNHPPRDIAVLVVDDQPRFLKVAGTVVERTAGFRLAGEAVDGLAAIEQVRALDPDLVLMDIHMPVLDGIEASRRIADEMPRTIVVLLSSYDKADLPAGVAGSGAADYLHKEELAPASLRTLWELHAGTAGNDAPR